MQIKLEKCELRSFREGDAETLAVHANNRNIWINLRDAFPHPYTEEHASEFIRTSLEALPESHFAIAVDGKPVGAIGFRLHSDVERVSAEVGYWLSESLWGQGIATEALIAMTKYAIDTFGLTRIYAMPFEWNPASMRVLEKAGYKLEVRMSRSAVKDGKIVDQYLYSYVAPE
jgi:RimJ/RimL family protein N-acetyltransferase